jgi:hypothetical protein
MHSMNTLNTTMNPAHSHVGMYQGATTNSAQWQYHLQEQQLMEQLGLRGQGVDRHLLNQNRRNFQEQRRHLPPSRSRASGGRSYSRYDSYHEEFSEDDDFIDNRELHELTDSGYAL